MRKRGRCRWAGHLDSRKRGGDGVTDSETEKSRRFCTCGLRWAQEGVKISGASPFLHQGMKAGAGPCSIS